MISLKQLERLQNDMKLIAKAVRVMGGENDQIKRQYAMSLVEDLFNNLFSDIQELVGGTGEKPNV